MDQATKLAAQAPTSRRLLARALLFAALLTGMGMIAHAALFACGMTWPGGGIANCPVQPAPAQPAPRLDIGLAREQVEGDRLIRELASIRSRLQQVATCPVPPPKPIPRPEPVNEELPEPVKEAVPEPVKVAEPPCVPRTIRTEQQLIVILDATPSMRIPLELSPDERQKVRHVEAEAPSRNAQPDPAAAAVFNDLMRGQHGRLTRLQAAKRDISAAVQSLGERQVALVTMTACQRFDVKLGLSSSGVQTAVSAVEVDDRTGGTDIAGALQAAAGRLVPNPRGQYDGLIMIVTDGHQSCPGDVCAVANEIHRNRPGISINVVDVAGHTPISCVTGSNGKLWRAGEGIDLQRLIREAQTIVDPASCPPRGSAGAQPARK